MPGEISSGLGLTVSIAIPTVPTTFYPGATPATKLCKNGGCGGVGGSGGVATTITTTTKAATTTAGGGGSCGAKYTQCGGTGWTGTALSLHARVLDFDRVELGPTCCTGSTCTYSSPYYSQVIKLGETVPHFADWTIVSLKSQSVGRLPGSNSLFGQIVPCDFERLQYTLSCSIILWRVK
jgi:hypothetical protein